MKIDIYFIKNVLGVEEVKDYWEVCVCGGCDNYYIFYLRNSLRLMVVIILLCC